MLQQKRSQIPFITYGFIDRTGQQEDADTSLDGEARKEREYVRARLREELQREPTEEELDEWLRQHTEGY
ncbi:MAG TPA: hypothetical protein VEV81_08355 [Pyrinomonadaceae bacterium]|nr:hypothetical protein [Pyrinomonadaceae bacterium]